MNSDGRVFKAGNSLAIPIPGVIAKHCELEDGTLVQMDVSDGTISVRKVPLRDLAALLARITPKNVHQPQLDDVTGAERC
jgi:antitoxin component of MazEF toxin-antitoxin module